MGLTNELRGNTSKMEFIHNRSYPIKFLFVIISIYSFDPVKNQFRPLEERVVDQNEYFYFTNISLILTIISVLIGIIRFQFTNNRIFNEIYQILAPIVIVLETCVTLLFWSLFLIDPALVKNDYNNSSVGGVSEYISELPKHAFPIIILILDQMGNQFKRIWFHRLFLISFCIIYGIFCEILILNEIYLYPVFKMLSFSVRIGLFAIVGLMFLVFYECLMYFKSKRKMTQMIKNKCSLKKD